jgi:hypothetical protein
MKGVAMSASQKLRLVIVFTAVVFLVAPFGLLSGLLALAVAIVRYAIGTAMLWGFVGVMKSRRTR